MKGKKRHHYLFLATLLQLDVEIWPQKSNKPSPKKPLLFWVKISYQKKKSLCNGLHNLICILAKFCTEKTLLLKDYCHFDYKQKFLRKTLTVGDSTSKKNCDYGNNNKKKK
jgi:hypothetical protein